MGDGGSGNLLSMGRGQRQRNQRSHHARHFHDKSVLYQKSRRYIDILGASLGLQKGKRRAERNSKIHEQGYKVHEKHFKAQERDDRNVREGIQKKVQEKKAKFAKFQKKESTEKDDIKKQEDKDWEKRKERSNKVKGCNWRCYLNRYPKLAKRLGHGMDKEVMTKAEEDWLEYGKKQKKDCGCKGILCMRLEKTGDKCMKRLDDVTALQKKIRKHKQNLKCVKAFTKHQERGKRRCIPAGTKQGSQGGVALVEFQIRTDTSGCGVETQYARKWSRFWQKRKNKPKFCAF